MRSNLFISAAARFGLASLILFICAGVVVSQNKADVKVKVDKAVKAEIKAGQREFCSSQSWSGDNRVSFNDLRETNIPSAGTLNIDAGRNGGIKVKGEDRSDVLLRACVQAWGESDAAARNAAGSVRISTSGGVVKAEGIDDTRFSVSYEARVPHNSNLKLTAHNGGISIVSVEGVLEFETLNGGINLSDVAGDVRGRTTNGGLNVTLAGQTWKGSGLDVSTTNGGVRLVLPDGYAANIETGTVNGGFRSEFTGLSVTTEDVKGSWGNRMKEVKTSINGGGPLVRATTKNGGVQISKSGSY
ncbi:MAG TPA: hypothetical protein PKD26_01165 [Pyrinomonadaceae bacterium]|nr:hypothetical protein [Pyrinomonadaceae bacterium]